MCSEDSRGLFLGDPAEIGAVEFVTRHEGFGLIDRRYTIRSQNREDDDL